MTDEKFSSRNFNFTKPAPVTFMKPFHRSVARRVLLISSVSILVSNSYAQERYPTCDKEPSETDTLAAKSAYKVGQISFQEADYDRAILYWEDAFTRDCSASALLLNLARAYELNGQFPKAIKALESYLEQAEKVKNQPSIVKRLEKLKARIQSASKPEEEKPEAKAEAPTEEKETSPVSSKPERSWVPVIVTGAGLTTAGIGGLFYGLSRSTLRDCNVKAQTCTNDAASEKAARALTLRNTGYVMLSVGGAAAVAGAVFWGLNWSANESSETSAAQLTPVFYPGYQGLEFSGHF